MQDLNRIGQEAIDQHSSATSHTPAQTSAPKPPRLRCRHLHIDGRQCGSACLRGEPFCYFHHNSRLPLQNARERKGRRSTFDLPLIEDRASIQQAIASILARITLNELDSRRAGLLLYGLQIASVNLPRLAALPEPAPSASEPPLEEIVEHPSLGAVAPESVLEETSRPLTTIERIQRHWEEQKLIPLPQRDSKPEPIPVSCDLEGCGNPEPFTVPTLHAGVSADLPPGLLPGCPILSSLIGKGGVSFAEANDRSPSTLIPLYNRHAQRRSLRIACTPPIRSASRVAGSA